MNFFGQLTNLQPSGLEKQQKAQFKTYAAKTNYDTSIHDEAKIEEAKEKETNKFSEEEINDILDILNELPKDELQELLDKFEDKKDDAEVSNETEGKIQTAMDEIEEKIAQRDEQQKELEKDDVDPILAKAATHNQFIRQEIYVDALKDFSAEELEEFIKEYGEEEFAKDILETFSWQAARKDNDYKEALEALRDKIEGEIDPELKNELFKNCSNYKNTVSEDGRLYYL